MTLNTTIAIHEPLPVREVLTECRRLLHAPDRVPVVEGTSDLRGSRHLSHPIDQGLAALLDIYYGADGPLGPWRGYEEFCDPAEDPEQSGWSAIVVTFDTGYAYRADNGARCSDLHAWLVTQLGQWLDGRGKTWRWQNEYTGEWFDGHDGIADFGDAERGELRAVEAVR